MYDTITCIILFLLFWYYSALILQALIDIQIKFRVRQRNIFLTLVSPPRRDLTGIGMLKDPNLNQSFLNTFETDTLQDSSFMTLIFRQFHLQVTHGCSNLWKIPMKASSSKTHQESPFCTCILNACSATKPMQ